MDNHYLRTKLSKKVMRDFGVVGRPTRLKGGQGTVWRVGNMVFKPLDDPIEDAWIAEAIASIEPVGFRIAQPVYTTSHNLFSHGWLAWDYLRGVQQEDSWREKLEVCHKFHTAIRHLRRPGFFDTMDHPWAIADRVAFGERKISIHPKIKKQAEELMSVLKPIHLRNQIIHGDISGNILFYPKLPPAVIDFSPYWRPANFAAAVLVVDALVWGHASPTILKLVETIPRIGQLLLRAELRRILEIDFCHRQFRRGNLDDIEAHLPIIRLLKARFA